MKMWSTLLAIMCGAGLIGGSPVEQAEGRAASSELPMEHRLKDPSLFDILGEMTNTWLNSRTASALDEAASHLTKAVGGFVDNIGDFVVGKVKNIPSTIEKMTERVGEAVQDGGEQVMIIVKGVKRPSAFTSASTNSTVSLGSGAGGALQTVDRVFEAVNQSKTATSMQELDKSIRLSIARIGATILANMGNIDQAVANGIRVMTRTGNATKTEQHSSPLLLLLLLPAVRSPICKTSPRPPKTRFCLDEEHTGRLSVGAGASRVFEKMWSYYHEVKG
ncbi:uncharacterized protein LOC135226990 [Macrobrachium nipponense]|uniref:uncharacterized protein LOC135226990 n=1 Tax=Macrobrachium nipponense TaxID=159736 RepID=UPI0030C7F4DA